MGRSPEFNVARGAALWAAAAVIYLAAEAVVAASCPGYSYARDYIGDLALPSGAVVRGHLVFSPRAALMRAAFYLQGILSRWRCRRTAPATAGAARSSALSQ